MTISSGGPSGWGDGLGGLDTRVKLELLPRKRPKRLDFDGMLDWVPGWTLGVEDREGGNDVAGVSKLSKPSGNTTL